MNASDLTAHTDFSALTETRVSCQKARVFPVFLQSFLGMEQNSASLDCTMSEGLTFNIVV